MKRVRYTMTIIAIRLAMYWMPASRDRDFRNAYLGNVRAWLEMEKPR